MSSWLSACAGVIAATIPVVGFVLTFTANRRAQHERVLTLTAESGTLPIAADRHMIGAVFEPRSKLPKGQPVILTGTRSRLSSACSGTSSASTPSISRYAHRYGEGSSLAHGRSSLTRSVGWHRYGCLLFYALEDEANRNVDTACSVHGLLHLSDEYGRLSAQRERQIRPGG